MRAAAASLTTTPLQRGGNENALDIFIRRCGRLPVFLVPTCLFLGIAPVWLYAAASDAPDIRRDATVMAVERVMPSVVNIATRTIVRVRDPFEELYRRFFGQQSPDSLISLGSGVIIDEAGYLLTNDHVVRRADVIEVKLAAGTNHYFATIVASDPKADEIGRAHV